LLLVLTCSRPQQPGVAAKPALALGKSAAAGGKPALEPVAGGKLKIALAGGATLKPVAAAKSKAAAKGGDDAEEEDEQKSKKAEKKDTEQKRPQVCEPAADIGVLTSPSRRRLRSGPKSTASIPRALRSAQLLAMI
jgi:hypothetical protein